MTNTIDWNAPLDDTPRDVWREIDVVAEYTSQPSNTREWAQYSDRLRQALARAIMQIRNRTTKPANAPSPELVEAIELLREVVKRTDFVRDYGTGHKTVSKVLKFLAELEPVDADVQDFWNEDASIADTDEAREAIIAFAAFLKRVRAEKG